MSQNLSGPGAHAAAIVSSIVQVAALLVDLGRCTRAGRRRASGSSRYAAAAVVAFVAFGKVLSPQYLVWLIPLVPLVRSRLAQVAARRARSC